MSQFETLGNYHERKNKMTTLKSFVIGAICMALACSVAFNFYQAGQIKSCVIMPAMQKIEMK